jgi:hypothetical protein
VALKQQMNIHFSMERGMRIMKQFFFVNKRIISTVNRVKSVSVRMLYIAVILKFAGVITMF